jgi:hypothetical protein
MQTFIGTKIIKAEPCEAWDQFGKHCPGTEGYKVEYEDSYISWSPKDVFEEAYREIEAMTFGLAIEALKKGFKVARAGWNGKGMWLMFIHGKEMQIHNHGFGPINEFDHDWQNRVPKFCPWIGMKTADNGFVPWLASQTDVLADDWQIVD